MKKRKLLTAVMALVMTLSSASAAFAGVDYSQWNSGGTYPSDITNTQYYVAVKILMDRKVITGDSDGLFHPEKSITRAEFATIMAKATNNARNLENDGKEKYFSDLGGYDWAKGYINAAAKANLIQGVGNGKYEPWRNVTYAEVITVVLRATNTSFNQITATGTWPQNVINYAKMYNVAGDTTIMDWNANATKGNVAKLVYRNMPKSDTASGNVTLSTATISIALIPPAGSAKISVPMGESGVTTTYQWYRNNLIMPGETSNALVIPFAKLVLLDKYHVVIKTNKVGYSETTATSGFCTVTL